MLKTFCKGIADAIRSKEGSTELINPQDFAQRIDSLQVGGGTAEPMSSWRYFKLNEGWQDTTIAPFIIPYTYHIGKFNMNGVKVIGTSGLIAVQLSGSLDEVEQIGYDMNAQSFQIDESSPVISFNEYFQLMVQDGAISSFADLGLTEITKEEFYNLES